MSLLEIIDLEVQIENKTILSGVSFQVEGPKAVAVLGPNGGGKTTLLKTLAGILPRSAKVNGLQRFRGTPLVDYDQKERAQRIAYVPSELEIAFPITVREMIDLGGLCVRNPGPSPEVCLQSVSLERWSDRWVHELSGGLRQRVLLARAMRQNPKIYLLDETFNKMDLQHQIQMRQWIGDRVSEGAVVLIVTHDYNLAGEWTDEALLLNQGSVFAFDRLDRVLTREKLKSLYAEIDIDVLWTPKRHKPKVIFE